MKDSLKYISKVAALSNDLIALIDSAYVPMDINEIDFTTWKRMQDKARQNIRNGAKLAVEAEAMLNQIRSKT